MNQNHHLTRVTLSHPASSSPRQTSLLPLTSLPLKPHPPAWIASNQQLSMSTNHRQLLICNEPLPSISRNTSLMMRVHQEGGQED
ncbi:hypothetical protein P692DRAFT_20835593, partial [Suillus brevipes Sb2]